jgi:hypothetical protein
LGAYQDIDLVLAKAPEDLNGLAFATRAVPIHPRNVSIGIEGYEFLLQFFSAEPVVADTLAAAGRAFVPGGRLKSAVMADKATFLKMVDHGQIAIPATNGMTAGTAQVKAIEAPPIQKEDRLPAS